MIYLLHFDRAYFRARHYLGFTDNGTEERLRQHLDGQGSPLVYAVVQNGISVRLVRQWQGGRQAERLFKTYKNTPRYCPVCNPQGWQTGWTPRGRKK